MPIAKHPLPHRKVQRIMISGQFLGICNKSGHGGCGDQS